MTATRRTEQLITWPQVAAFRLGRHHLAERDEADVAGIARDVCGVQAQVGSAAEMALCTRSDGLARAAIHAALWKRRALVKTSCMRSTLHLLATADLPIYIAALRRSRLHHMHRVMKKYGGVTEELARRVTEAAVEVLRDGPLSRGEVTKRVLAQGIARGKARKWFEMAWWGVTRQAIVEGLICYRPDPGQQVTFILVDQWLPKQKRVAEDEAKQILLRRYLAAYGPATVRDFSKWSGVPVKEADSIWQSLGDELTDVLVEGKKASLLRTDCEALATAGLRRPVLRLLPNFDAYLLAHADKSWLVETRHYSRVYRQAGWISPVVLLNGRVVGTWSSTQNSKGLLVTVELFGRAARTTHALIEEEAQHLGRFLKTRCQVRFTTQRRS